MSLTAYGDQIINTDDDVPLIVKRAPVLTLWAFVVAERLGHSRDTALTLGRAVGGPSARIKVKVIGRDHWKVPDPELPQRCEEPPIRPVFLLGKTIRLLPDVNGELRAAFRTLPLTGLEVADEFLPADPTEVKRYLARAFGDHLTEVKAAMEELAHRYDPAELNRIGFHLYEKFRPDVRDRNRGGWAQTVLVEKILAVG